MDSIILVRIYRAKTIDGMMLLNDVFDLTVVPNMRSWCLTPLSSIFQLYGGNQFIGGVTRSTRRKPPTCCK
jgi:hypothetical protein